MANRVTQAAKENLFQPTDLSVRVTQVAKENLFQPTDLSVRVTQVGIEILGKNPSVVPPPPQVNKLFTYRINRTQRTKFR